MYLHSKRTDFSRVRKGLEAIGLAFLLLITANLAQAEPITLELIDGTIYTDVQVKRSQPTTLSFKHAEGFATVPAGALTDESLSKLGLNPADNPDFKTQREEMGMKENLRTLKKNRATISGGVGTGQTIKTKDITDINPITILVTEDGVPRRVEIITLPKDIQQELGYDPAKAAEFTKNKTQAESAASVAAAKVKAEQDKIDLENQKKRTEAENKAAADAAARAKAAPAATNSFNVFTTPPK